MNPLFILLMVLLLRVVPAPAQSGKEEPDPTLTIMKKVADWQLDHWRKDGSRWPAYDWVNAACYTGISALARVSGDSTYYHALYAIGERLDWNTGPHRTMADDYCIGQLYCELFAHYRDPRIVAHLRAQFDTICSLPHTESLEWVNDIYLREWAWCDALFMGPAGLAALSAATGDPKYLITADSLWWKTTGYLYDPADSLFFRDSRYFHQQEPNGQKMFWSRGNGWVMAGMVRLLDRMPQDFAHRGRMIALYRQMAARIAGLQQSDGGWRTSLLDQGRYPNKETSGTAFYCFALAWGVHHGILDRKSYWPVVLRAWEALKNAVQPDGRLGFVQQIGDQPGAADANSTEAYAVGGFLLAGSEMLVKNYTFKKRESRPCPPAK
jgi:unsaturated rhamnogalacturonyl hydrolase